MNTRQQTERVAKKGLRNSHGKLPTSKKPPPGTLRQILQVSFLFFYFLLLIIFIIYLINNNKRNVFDVRSLELKAGEDFIVALSLLCSELLLHRFPPFAFFIILFLKSTIRYFFLIIVYWMCKWWISVCRCSYSLILISFLLSEDKIVHSTHSANCNNNY